MIKDVHCISPLYTQGVYTTVFKYFVPKKYMLIKILYFSIILLIILIFTFFSFPFLFGAPYEKSKNKQIKTIVEFSKNSKHVAELGSGSGEIAIELAKRKIKVDCYEINPFLILYLKFKIKKLEYKKNIKIIWGNFFDYNLSMYDTIFLFQFGTIMKKLEKKFNKELKENTKIISNHWKLPNKIPKKIKNDIFLYTLNHQT